jgi:hypothetical protein
MIQADELARDWARTLMARAPWAEGPLAEALARLLAAERRALVLACCRAACEDCRQSEPERVEDEGYYLHRPPGMDLFIECRSGDIRAALLDAPAAP